MKLIIFDMDGTIVNSGAMIAKTINFVRKNIGLEEMEQNIILSHINNPNINPANFFYNSDIFTDEQTKLFCEYYDKNCIIGVEIYDGIVELLEDLKQNYTLSIATNASTVFAEKILNHLEIKKYFTKIVGADLVKEAKPNPEMLLKTIDELGAKKSNTILVGDSQKDKLASQKAKIDSILVNWGFSNYDKNAVDDVKELKKLINYKFKKTLNKI